MRFIILVLLSVSCLFAASGKAPAGLDGNWIESYTDAMKLSAKYKVPVLADFTGSDWCGWCVKLKKEVFSKPAFTEWAKGRVVLLELDYPQQKEQSEGLKKQNKALAQKYGIQGFPTVLVLDTKGAVLRKWGYAKGGPEAWIDGMVTNVKGLESLARSK